MAGGTFVKDAGKVRPGTYTNFEDIDPRIVPIGGGGSGGDGGGGPIKPDDYIIGKIFAVTTTPDNSTLINDFVAAADDVYCGTLVYD